jgi:hypothetical protein
MGRQRPKEPELTPDMWRAWQKEVADAKEDPDVLLQRFGGLRVTYDLAKQVQVTETVRGRDDAPVLAESKLSVAQKIRRTERLRALVEGIQRDVKAERATRERLYE